MSQARLSEEMVTHDRLRLAEIARDRMLMQAQLTERDLDAPLQYSAGRLYDVPIEDTGRIGLWGYVVLSGKARVERSYRAFGKILPKRDRAIIILPQKVGPAIIVKVTRRHDVPRGTNELRPIDIKLAIRFDRRGAGGVASHLPDSHRTIGVLPHDIAFAVAIEIRHSYRFPRR